jgi:hypothetical protein
MSVIDTAAKILDEARARIQANMAMHYRTENGERWINASGRSSDAFKVERGRDKVILLYRGDDVAPLFSIQDGTTGIAPVSVLERWISDKGLDLNPWAVRANIKKRGGTERHVTPQDWVVQPAIDEAMEALRRDLPASAKAAVKEELFKGAKL